MTDHVEPLARAHAHALAYLDSLDTRAVGTTATLAQMRARLGGPLPHAGTPPTQVVDELVAGTEGGHLGSTTGRFFAWVIGGALPAALAADWLTSVWDQNGAIYDTSPSAAVAEEIAGAWLLELLGLPRTASFALVTGCQMAHMTCLAAARHALLARRGWDVEADGLAGAPPIRVLATSQRHTSIDRALRFLGIGSRALVALDADANGCLTPATLTAALAKSDAPTILSLNAGDLNLGAFDPFPELIDLAHAAGAWVHIDGAFGLWARAAPTRAHLTAGIERADSWATDAHKWLNTPFDCGVAVVAEAAAHRAAMTVRASYFAPSDHGRDAIDWNPEWSRRARGFAVWAALRELGRDGVADLIERCCTRAAALAHGIAALPGAELIAAPVLNQALVCFPDPSGRSDLDRTDAVIAAINAGGEVFFGGVSERGRRAMRISVVNWRTTEADVARTVSAVEAAIGG